jgi:hypothetical protein
VEVESRIGHDPCVARFRPFETSGAVTRLART